MINKEPRKMLLNAHTQDDWRWLPGACRICNTIRMTKASCDILNYIFVSKTHFQLHFKCSGMFKTVSNKRNVTNISLKVSCFGNSKTHVQFLIIVALFLSRCIGMGIHLSNIRTKIRNKFKEITRSCNGTTLRCGEGVVSFATLALALIRTPC